MKTILIKNKNRGKILIDDEDFEIVSKYSWSIHKRKGHYLYAITSVDKKTSDMYGGYECNSVGHYTKKNGEVSEYRRFRYRLLLHRLILGKSTKLEIDHVNGNGLDNRKENLRVCEHKHNMYNKKLYKNNTSGYKGVTKSGNKWGSSIKHEGRHIHLGNFENKIDAALAYNKAAINYFGEFARINDL